MNACPTAIAGYDQSISIYSCMILLQKLGREIFSRDNNFKGFLTLGLTVKLHRKNKNIFAPLDFENIL